MSTEPKPLEERLEAIDSGPDAVPWLEELPPRQIVVELDRYIVGQANAKKAVAIAIRNRWRRQHAPEGIRDEILPNNIIMIGPTGVGKTEIARRLARLAGAPFIKVEASKFTEVGYVGRDVESMVRDLVDASINMVRSEREDDVFPTAERRAEERLLDLLLPPPPKTRPRPELRQEPVTPPPETPAEPEPEAPPAGQALFMVSSSGEVRRGEGEEPLPTDDEERRERTREKLRKLLADGKLEDREVEIEVTQQAFPAFDMMAFPQGMEGADINFTEMLQDMLPKRTKKRVVRLTEARRILVDEELRKLVDTGSRTTASSSSTSSTRSPASAATWADPTSRARACSAISCLSSRVRPCRPAMGTCAPITSCSSRPARSTYRSRPISFPSCRAASRSAPSYPRWGRRSSCGS
jgi:ATP-dependent HslUV protease ATP-binding subunit HslU